MSGEKGLLRAPPFPGLHDVAAPPEMPDQGALALGERAALFAAMREARVGGAFWAEPIDRHALAIHALAPTVLRGQSDAELAALQTRCGNEAVLALGAGDDGIDPWSVLTKARRLIAHGADEWIALACVIGLPVEVLSPGRFGEPGDSAKVLAERAAYALSQPMHDPFSRRWIGPWEAIAVLAEWRRVIDANRGSPGERIVAACGISWWKRAEIRQFLWSPGKPVRIFASIRRALAAARAEGGALAVWPSRISPNLITKAKRAGVALVRVEDGFVRSVGLGSNLVPPLSVIVDRRGIHFDPQQPSDLEHILGHGNFPPALLDRAARLRTAIIAAGISKYASAPPHGARRNRSAGARRMVLVPGQVEDDMSVIAGGGGIASNLELLRRTRAIEPEAEIWWRPHPDVDAGHRNGAIADAAALEHADRIVRRGSMADLLDAVDGVHVLTSLAGFEALLRGRDVTCHGTPFYAGWGLTRDLGAVPARRGRPLTLDQLVAGVLLLYPRYLDPVTALSCPPEVLVQRMAAGEMPNRLGWVGPVRRAQGRMMALLRRKGRR
ncbi:MAG: beta-3-deoxy-D-manno-oct-2-ulosonic acid transferase [Alphaproteobacteria bacterium HGW-Alphaproteobacteria-14]|nr:MAG: beta-3-deoxy-D-manno-oct-2-ulosonic acid transferase [Alphaproteobacteria bacterium HGW-Alphaproteobacteria-14]